ncbi:ABC transporter [Phytophthora megakarya]|uniref:ABC transporter n=1 Tax=Phytophthora megakarya TaxID=4795 RepID=A0A225WS21_9STRA|nr:ABC transporter [Phytophthora megakarya]
MAAHGGTRGLIPVIGYDDGKALMARGPLALHEHVASRLETSLGKALPQMEVRFRDVSISADIVVKDASDLEVQLPTLPNEMMKMVHGLVAKRHTVTKRVLKGVSGVLKPGTITLVLGQPGSGKSSLMKLLSGRFPKDKNVSIEGEVTYNGTPAEKLHKRLPQLVSYVPQRDKHYPELTVKETLDFAHAASGGEFPERDARHLVKGTPEENAEALKAAEAMVKHYPDVVIQQLGLDNCQNTIVGDAMHRGVSGGERKRVTTGEMAFGNKYVMMMDEISTGLDSAATFDIITTQRSLAKKFRKTVVISLLQPSPEVFALFDDVMILNAGHLMYHGPCEEALNYFESLGFKCPPSRDVADFLLDIGTNKQYQYEMKVKGGSAIPSTPSEFADTFERSSIYAPTLKELGDPYSMTMGEYSLSTYEVPSEKFWLCPENVVLDNENTTKNTDSYVAAQTPKSSPSSEEIAVSVQSPKPRDFTPVTVAFKDLWYTVPDPTNPKETIDLLKGISGYALPGTITALMGSSGAGKTTLMDVIAGRKTGGKIRGQILLNGHPATDLAIRRSTGYCEQMDIHCESSTIREALTFSAFLRQGSDIPDSHKYDSVDECLDLLDLNPIADQIIRGSSVEQMKRLTIGVELAAQPSVLFLDEPTSGLDARSAKLIMDGVRKVADTGRTIVCTIHQPSTEVFSVFDSLLLLKRGGETVFAGDLGENASEMISYFESIDGVAKLEQAYNPATWMLEVIGAGVGNSNGDTLNFVELFKTSIHFNMLQMNLDQEGVSRPSPSLPALKFSDKRAASELTQAKFLLKRFSDLYWRTASFNLTRYAISLGLGLLFGITYASAEYKSYSGVNSGMGMIYLAVGFVGLVSFNGLIPVVAEERAVFYRERASQTYNAFWYFVGLSVMEIPYVLAAVLLFMIPFFPLVGFTGVGAFFTCWLVLSLHVLHQAYMAELLVFLLPNLEVAEIVGVLVTLISYLFSGFSPPASTLPSGTVWLYDITPMTYSMAAFSTVVFGSCKNEGDIGCTQMTGVPPSLHDGITVQGYLEDKFLMKHSEIWRNCGILVGFVLLFCAFTLLAMRFINYQKR